MEATLKTSYDTLTTKTPTTKSREYYLARRRRRQGQTRGGGKIQRFEDIGRHHKITIQQIISGDLPKYVGSEFQFYRWFVGPIYCYLCGEKLTKQTKTRDHVIPRYHGGSNLGPDNLEPCCATCNRAKGNRSLLFFLTRRKELDSDSQGPKIPGEMTTSQQQQP